jgi:hypothetical protein
LNLEPTQSHYKFDSDLRHSMYAFALAVELNPAPHTEGVLECPTCKQASLGWRRGKRRIYVRCTTPGCGVEASGQ